MTLKSDYCATNYLLQLVPSKVAAHQYLRNRRLSDTEAQTLRLASTDDAHRYLYNAFVSFLGALHSFHDQEAVWTVTKMYYSVFYMMRASLCRSHYLVFHVPKGSSDSHTQFVMSILPGAVPEVAPNTPSTHKLVARMFRERGYPSFMTGLEIAGDDPVQWLLKQREYWQYRSGRFPDPELPDSLATLDVTKLSLLFETYANDATGAYLSDPSHALLAFPFRMLAWSMSAAPLLMDGVVDSIDIEHLRKRCLVSSRKISAVDRLLQSQ